METKELTETIAAPIGTVGMMFYFSPQSTKHAEALGTDVVTLYGGGRGGVLGDISSGDVDTVFYFFKPGMIAGVVEKSRGVADREALVAAHMAAANEYADATFGGVSDDVLSAFSDAAEQLVASLSPTRWPLVEGYLSLSTPTSPRQRAYYWSIILRELRGGIHTDVVKDLAISPSASCQLDREGAYFALHGYADEDRVEETPELVALRQEVEAETTNREAAVLEVLNDAERSALAAGALALGDAVANPVPAG